jgi:hypothetical protein
MAWKRCAAIVLGALAGTVSGIMFLVFVVLLLFVALAWAGDWISNYHRMIFCIVVVNHAAPATALVGLIGGLLGGLHAAFRGPQVRTAPENTWTTPDAPDVQPASSPRGERT